MESDFDFCARRAAEEFVAANRAATREQRKHHRELAQHYADLVRAMIMSRAGKAGETQLSVGATAPPVAGDEVQAA